jgi:hypothetical protein
MFDKLIEVVVEGKSVDVGPLAREAPEKGLHPSQSVTEGLIDHIQLSCGIVCPF